MITDKERWDRLKIVISNDIMTLMKEAAKSSKENDYTQVNILYAKREALQEIHSQIRKLEKE